IDVPSQKQSVGEILAGAAIWAVGGVLSALGSLALGPEAGVLIQVGVVALAGLASGAASGFQSWADNAFASGAGSFKFNVPVTAITNSELNYDNLNNMATSIKAGALQQWNNIYKALTTAALSQGVLSNYGLLKAFAVMSGQPLSDSSVN